MPPGRKFERGLGHKAVERGGARRAQHDIQVGGPQGRVAGQDLLGHQVPEQGVLGRLQRHVVSLGANVRKLDEVAFFGCDGGATQQKQGLLDLGAGFKGCQGLLKQLVQLADHSLGFVDHATLETASGLACSNLQPEKQDRIESYHI